MRKILLLCLLCLLLCSCAKTIIKGTLKDGTVIEFFDNKTRTGTTVNVKVDKEGVPEFTYKSESSDANSVALKAIGLADTTLKAAATVVK